MKYRVKRSLIESDPRWVLLGKVERDEIADLIDERGSVLLAIMRYREVTGKGLAESKDAVGSIIADSQLGRKGAGLPCPQCGQPLRTQKAEQCFECGADWHKESSNKA